MIISYIINGETQYLEQTSDPLLNYNDYLIHASEAPTMTWTPTGAHYIQG